MEMPQNNNESEEKNIHGFTKEEWEAMDEMDREGYELAYEYEQEHPDMFVEVEKNETNQQVELFKALIDAFEANFPLEQLNAIETKEEALNSKLREAAIPVSNELHERFKSLSKTTKISTEEVSEIEAKLKNISKAIGFINSGKVRHD